MGKVVVGVVRDSRKFSGHPYSDKYTIYRYSVTYKKNKTKIQTNQIKREGYSCSCCFFRVETALKDTGQCAI